MDENEDRKELNLAANLMAAQLIEVVKKMRLTHFRLPLVDTYSVWEVNVQEMRVEEPAFTNN